MALDTALSGELLTYDRVINNAELYDDGCLRIEHASYYIAYKGKVISLSRKEFLIVSRLAKSVERTVKSEELWHYAWGSGAVFNARSLRVHIHRLRRELAPYCVKIESMINVGYRLSLESRNGHNVLTSLLTSAVCLSAIAGFFC